MSEEVVGLARKDGRLLALVSVAHREPSEPVLRCELRERPVDAVRVALRPHQRRAAIAWEGLRAADWDDPRVVAAALTVLIESVPLGDSGAGPRPPAQFALCAPDAWRRVRTAVGANERGVLRLLRRAGHGPQVVTLIHARDPYLAYHHRAPSEPGLAALPPRFAAFVLPLLRGRPWSVVRRALALYWSLDLQRDEAALALAVHLLAKGPEHGLAWLEWMARDQPTRRDLMGRLVLETGALAHDPRALPARTLDVLAHEDGAEYCDRLAMMLHGLGQRADLEYLLEGVQVAQLFAPRYRFDGPHGAHVAHRHPAVPAGVAEDHWRVLERIHESVEPNWWWSDAVWLWDWCASSPERAALIRRASSLDWPALTTF
ncbi:MAG TPA: hypothetical protein VFQ51_18390, partial [Vicinamibacteria bacterium]|nr:hypothetical protein [Vicinamibacteria bacterium]